MTIRRALGAAIMVAVLAGCHAHGDKAVTATDHGVTISLKRTAQDYSTVALEIRNGSASAVCLGSGSLSLGAASGATLSGGTSLSLGAASISFAPA